MKLRDGPSIVRLIFGAPKDGAAESGAAERGATVDWVEACGC